MKAPVLYQRYGKIRPQRTSWGEMRILFKEWSEHSIDGFLLTFKREAAYGAWCGTSRENVCIVERGSGTLSYAGNVHELRAGFAFRVLPGETPMIKPKETLVILSVQMKCSAAKIRRSGEHLEVVNPAKDRPAKVYEFETLAHEVIIPRHKPGLGLLRFVFPLDAIPLHRHPFSGRLIRPIKGKGYTYAEPNIYEAKNDSFALFPKNMVHTNGPVPGTALHLWAFQLPWVPSHIDEVNIAGSPRFVRYVGPTPPRKLWKKKEDFERVLRRFSR